MNIKSRIYQFFPYLCLVIFISFLCVRLLIVNSNGTDIGGIEQNVVYSIQVYLDQDKLYLHPGEAPFSITQYTPIYYYLCGITAKLTGHSANDVHIIYVIGRAWNVLFNLITAFLLFNAGRFIFNLSKNKCYFLFVLSFSLLFSHNFAIRSDSLTDMLCMASIYSYFLYYKKRGNGNEPLPLLILTVLLSALAVFSKQSGIQLIVIFVGFSFLIGDWKTFVKLIISALVIYSGFLLLYNYLYSSFFLNVVGGIANGIDMPNFFYVLKRNAIILSFWPIMIISVFILIKKNNVFKGAVLDRLLATCTLGTLVFAMVTLLKMGSSAQYFILFMNLALLMIMTSIQHATIASTGSALQKNIFPIFYAFLLLVIMMYGAYHIKAIYNNDYDPYIVKQREAAVRVAEFIKNDQPADQPFYLFSNVPTDSSLPSRQGINNTFFRNALVPQMDILEYSTGKSKVIGYKKLEEMFKNGEVKYIIEPQPKSLFVLLDNLENIKKSRYKLIKQFDGYLIYKLLPN